MNRPRSYREAGVDLAHAAQLVERIRSLAARTYGPEVVPAGDAYAGLFRPQLEGLHTPVLAATCDGVGTKLLVARDCRDYRGIGQDLVAMNVNDLLPRGARPLFFLDYIATGKLESVPLLEIAEGLVQACAAAGCALLGGETAELPDAYREGDCDLAGFAVGLVEEAHVPSGAIKKGDVVLGLPSSGLHSNGYSLVRKLLAHANVAYGQYVPELGRSLAEELLIPTRIYVNDVLGLMRAVKVKAAAHITGGGLLHRGRKLARDGLGIEIDPASYPRPPIFDYLARLGSIADPELAATFNMGLGFLVIVDESDAAAALARPNTDFRAVGRVVAAAEGIQLGYAAL